MDGGIHIHALWRTGSTWLWSRFREDPGLRTFYEPFHENLATRTHDQCTESHSSKPKHSIFRHPQVADHYFAEYPLAEHGGVTTFRSKFVLEDFIVDQKGTDPELHDYLNALAVSAREHGQIPTFQYNRSILRAAWIKEQFGGVHCYLIRNPFGMHRSAVGFAAPEADSRGPGNYFLACPVMIVGKNSESEVFNDVAKLFGLTNFCGDSFGDELSHYGRMAESLPEQAHRDITAFFWSLGICYAASKADIIVDVDSLHQTQKSQTTERKIHDLTGREISLQDARPFDTDGLYLLVSNEMQAIIKRMIRESKVDLAPIFEAISSPTTAEFLRRLAS